MLNLNDWNFRKFAVVSLSLLVAFNGAVILDCLNIDIPFLRQIFGFLFLTFIPGYTILKVLKIHKINEIEIILFAIGLSITYIMVFGLFVSIFYPIVGIKNPIRLKQLLVALNITYLLLLSLAYISDKSYYRNLKYNLKEKNTEKVKRSENIFNPYILVFSFLPISAVWGVYIFNYFGYPTLIVLVLFILALFPIFIVLKKNVRHLTLITWISTISLLYISEFGISWDYIWGSDITYELYLSRLVSSNGVWNYEIPHGYNTALSVVILNPIYSILLNIGPITVFKIIYIFIFSLIPVGLFIVYKKIFNNNIKAFLTTFFFISLPTFFIEMLQLARQQIAEIYLALILLLLFERGLNKIQKYSLLILFSFSLVVSHYGVTWLFLISLIYGLAIYNILYPKKDKSSTLVLHKAYIFILFILAILWYTTIAKSFEFNKIVYVGNAILSSVYELFNPEIHGLYLITRNVSGLYVIGKYIYLLSQGIIGIGILWLLTNYKNININKEFISLSIIWFIYDIAGIIIPHFSNALNASRLYHISLFFLAPFEVIGWFTLYKLLKKVARIQLSKSTILKSFAIFLTIYLIFTSSVIYKISGYPPYSANITWWPLYYPYLDKNVPFPKWSNIEIVSGLWLKAYKNQNMVYGDLNGVQLFSSLLGLDWRLKHNYFRVNWNKEIVEPKIKNNSYLFLSAWNINNKKLEVVFPMRIKRDYISLDDQRINNIILKNNKIYSSKEVWYYFIN